jgi:ATP-dependent helicase HrpA
MVGVTQPRRIAAQAVAARLAEEMRVPLGAGVGLTVRFTDRTQAGARIKVMTDGILLNEIRRDRMLRAYDALIIDEAHESSFNIDFILGYLQRVTARRPDLKVVITSATIDPERFSRHFGGAPVVLVEGRSFPVEVRYRPRDEDQDLADAVCAAAEVLAAESDTQNPVRDVLVFLPGERFIRDAAHALARRGPRGYEVLPLYARLTSARQRRILSPGKTPRIVLATNVAETSLTVPRIRYVIDSGLARIARFATRHRVQSLRVEPIARANAEQRAGRCGRLAPGVCVRLYSEEDFLARPEFGEPEILRTGLADVILRLESLKLGPIAEFPFIDAPPAKAVSDAYQLLQTLHAVDAERRLTGDGAAMARLPVDPRIARLLLVADRTHALREALVVAAALSVVDAREHGAEDADAARQRHEAFADARSDFGTYLNLWDAYKHERRSGQRALRVWCKENFLSAARLREWHDVHTQLHELTQALGWRTRAANADYRALHQAVLAAFVDFIAEHEEGMTYRGIREARALLFPGTPLAKKRPRWIVAAERVATERSYLRTVAQINPRWVLAVAPHLVKREYVDPAWDERRGRVMAREVVKLYGFTIAADKRIDYGRVAPDAAREIFIAEALVARGLAPTVEGTAGLADEQANEALGANAIGPVANGHDDATSLPAVAAGLPPFAAHNRALRERVQDWEARLRRRDLYAGDAQAARLYDERLPRGVRDRATLAAWCAEPGHDASLAMQPHDLATVDLEALDEQRYPREIEIAGQLYGLRFAFAPGAEHDGLTLELPQALAAALRPEPLEWLVPGWLAEKVTALLKQLPKELRRELVPVPDTVREWLPEIEGRAAAARRTGGERLGAVLRELAGRRGVLVPQDALDESSLPEHLRMRVAVLDADGKTIAAGRDLPALQRRDAGALRRARRAARPGTPSEQFERTDLARWDFGDLPERATIAQQPRPVELYPALVDDNGRVDLRLLPPGPAAVERHRNGVRRLTLKQLPQQVALIRRETLARRELVLGFHGIGAGDELVDDVVDASADASFVLDPPIRTQAAFEAAVDAGRAEFVASAAQARALLEEILPLYRELRAVLATPAAGPRRAVQEAIEAQLAALVRPGFLAGTPANWRKHLPRYLRAALARWQRAAGRPSADAPLEQEVRVAEARLERWRELVPPEWPWPEAVVEYRWMIEELRVSLFAQTLGTVRPVSAKRLQQAWQRAVASPGG